MIWSLKDLDFNLLNILRAFFTGFVFDFTIGCLFLSLYIIYVLVLPKRWVGSLFDKCFTYFYLTLIFIIIYFSLLAEIPFWDEIWGEIQFYCGRLSYLHLRSYREYLTNLILYL